MNIFTEYGSRIAGCNKRLFVTFVDNNLSPPTIVHFRDRSRDSTDNRHPVRTGVTFINNTVVKKKKKCRRDKNVQRDYIFDIFVFLAGRVRVDHTIYTHAARLYNRSKPYLNKLNARVYRNRTMVGIFGGGLAENRPDIPPSHDVVKNQNTKNE